MGFNPGTIPLILLVSILVLGIIIIIILIVSSGNNSGDFGSVCSSDAECGPGDVCYNGACLRGLDQSCTSDSDCVTGKCSSGLCSTATFRSRPASTSQGRARDPI